MKKSILFIILLCVIIPIECLCAVNQVKGPDFAYPKEVTSQSEAGINQALKTENDIQLLRSLMNYAIAQTLISQDNAPTVIAKINTIKSEEKDSVTVALLNVMLADIYSQLYQNKRFIYDNRANVEDDDIMDYTQWSGKRFKQEINGYIDLAMTAKRLLQQESIQKYAEIIEIPSRYTAVYYPTLYDFVVVKAIEFQDNNFMSSIEFYNELLAFHEQQGDTAAIINTEINRLKLVSSNVGLDDDEYSNKLYALYQRMQNNEYSGDILKEYADRIYLYGDISRDEKLLKLVTDFLTRFPHYYNADCLYRAIDNIKIRNANVSVEGIVNKGGLLNLKVMSHNVDSLNVNIYKVNKQNNRNYYVLNGGDADLIKTIPVTFKGTVPFKQDTVIYTTIDDYGYYVVDVNFEGGKDKSKEKYYDELVCTDLLLYSTNYDNKLNVWVVNPQTGLPVKDCSIVGMDENNRVISNLWKTDENGFVSIKNNKIKSIRPVKGDDKYAPNVSVWNNVKNQNNINKTIINTDLAVYRQGDTVKWSIVRYKSGETNEIVADEEVKMVLKNANREVLDTKVIKVDKWGRAEGSFVIPEDGLMGNYTLTAEMVGEKSDVYGTKLFMVSDYKLSTFFVKIDEIKKDSIGNVAVKGNAASYSGFPVANASVDVVVAAEKFSIWRFDRGQKFEIYTHQIKTNEKGEFEFELSKVLLDNVPVKNVIFNIDVSVTSESGETRFTSTTFSDKYSTVINYKVGQNINIDNAVSFEILTTDLSGKEIKTNVKCILQKDGKTVLNAAANSGENVVDWSDLSGGKYKLCFAVDNDTVKTDVFLYHLNDKKIPVTNEILWLPEYKYYIDGDKAVIVYGTSLDNLNMNCLVFSADGEISRRWIKAKSGIHTFDVAMPEGKDEIKVKLVAVGGCQYEDETITIVRKPRKLDVEIESFRDKLMPGTQEKWTIRVNENADTAYQSAVMLNMYNKALDELVDYNFSIFNTGFYWYVNVYCHNMGYIFNSDMEKLNYRKNCINIIPPDFETYHHSFVKSNIRPYLEMKVRNSASIVKQEVAFGSMMYDGVAEESEEIVEDIPNASEDFAYRDMEVVSAFFRPMLATDSLGRLEFSFTAPNANGAWKVVAFAYTKELLSVLKEYEIVTSKPLMVQANLPRFLRGGDKAEIKAVVMNNTDSAVVANTIVEIFNTATNDVLQTKAFKNNIGAKSSAMVSIQLDAPQDMVMIGYRIKSSMAKYSDGEQGAIAILPSKTPVIESKQFYMSSNEAVCEMELPALKGENARATMQYCENPVWYCVTALPGLREGETTTVISAMNAIFSAAVASDIVRKNQDIASVLYKWGEQNDSTLVSMLERNEDLKVALLNATPWVMDAQSDTERMARLALLFDDNEIKNTYSSNVKKLVKMKAKDGGFSWIEGGRMSSQWTTMEILKLYGRMTQLKCAPDNKELKMLMEGAVKYMDEQYAKYYKQNKLSNSMACMYYVYIRNMYSDVKMSATAKRIMELTTQSIISNWRNYDLKHKALSAIILDEMGYHATAKSVMKSLEEYSMYKPSRGMYWAEAGLAETTLILNAFNRVMPESECVEKIRQWLILQKEGQNWGTSTTTSDVIASILETSNVKLSKMPYRTEIKIGEKNVEPSNIEQTLGYFRTDVSSMLVDDEELTVKRPVGQPSWGAVIYQYVDDMSQVEAVAGDGISITKELYVKELTDKGVVWIKTSSYNVGDVVKVQLTIKADKDIDYVVVNDERAACFEPVQQMPEPKVVDGIYFYQEVRDDCTNIYIDSLPKGTYIIDYDMTVNNAGEFSAGIATVQSLYAPSVVAHSSGKVVNCND